MNGLKTTDNGGFPFQLDDLRWIDSGIREAFKGIMSAYGIDDSTAVILSGCQRSGGGTVSLTEGYVSIGGEICYVPAQTWPAHAGGTDEEYFVIESTFDPAGSKTFESASVYDTYELRRGKIQTGVPPAGHTSLSDIRTLHQIAANSMFPDGMIMMWSGLASSIPYGWALCDGTGGTPDLRGRFVVGYDDRTTDPLNGIWDSDYNTIGLSGGYKNANFFAVNLASHDHNIDIYTATGVGPVGLVIPGAVVAATGGAPLTVQTAATGSNQPHENRPPFLVLAYIMKVTPVGGGGGV